MKDQVFSGESVAAAVREASTLLGVAEDRLRFVVLEEAQPPRPGYSGRLARIAVMLEGGGSPHPVREADPAPRAEAEPGNRARPGEPGPRLQPRDSIGAALDAFSAAVGLDLVWRLEEGEEGLRLHLEGPATEVLLEEEGEVLRALEHVVQKVASRDPGLGRLRVSCEGYRAMRDEAVKRTALELAELVRADGKPRQTEPMNSYERRLVHVAVADEMGLTTYSVGEGQDRRVTIAPRTEAESGPDKP